MLLTIRMMRIASASIMCFRGSTLDRRARLAGCTARPVVRVEGKKRHLSVAAALEHYQQRPALGFSDCLILEVARKVGHRPLATFDRDLGKLAGAQRL
jgi:predicted nucleic acid-binding protein